MSDGRASYAVVTAARDEAANLPVLAAALAAQTHPPALWLVVENGSGDDTLEVARRLERDHAWIRVLSVPSGPAGVRGGNVVRAFTAGLDALDERYDAVAKLDADVSVDPDYFERLLAAFADDPSLGMASGTCVDEIDGEAQERFVTGAHVWGAARVYRRDCLHDVLPLHEAMGWDGIDQIKAVTCGWRTATLRELPFRHHRREGARDGSRRRAWAAQGRAAHYMGYRFSYLLLRTLHRARREPAALSILVAYLGAAVRRDLRCADAAVRAHLRSQQRLRHLPARVREARGA